MILSTVSVLQQLDDEWRAEHLAAIREQKKKKDADKADGQSYESRLAYLEAEVRTLKKQIQGTAGDVR